MMQGLWHIITSGRSCGKGIGGKVMGEVGNIKWKIFPICHKVIIVMIEEDLIVSLHSGETKTQ